MSASQIRFSLKLNAGSSASLTRELVCGAPEAPFSVGTHGEWSVHAPGVSERHLFFAFDGIRLFTAAASTEHSVHLNGALVGLEWTAVSPSSVLVFGGASLTIELEDAARCAPVPLSPRPIIDLSRADRQPTQVVDLSRTQQLRTRRLEVSPTLLAALREAPPEPPVTPPQRPATQPASIQSGDTLMFQTAPVRTLAFPLPPELRHTANTVELANTLYDGGALRELAAQLVSSGPPSELPTPTVSSPAVPAEKPSVLRRPLAAFRRSSVPKQLTIALLPLAVAGVWMMRDGSASASSVSVPAAAARASSAPAHAATAARLSTVAPVASTVAPIVSAAALVALIAPPAGSAAPAGSASPAPAWLASRAPTPAPPGQPAEPNERLALIAAFSGNRSEAAALYERLAIARGSHTFALAARLSREDRVRKP